MPKLKTLPKVRVGVTIMDNGEVLTKIFGPLHFSCIFREGVNARESMRGEILLRDAIREFGLSLEEIKFLRP